MAKVSVVAVFYTIVRAKMHPQELLFDIINFNGCLAGRFVCLPVCQQVEQAKLSVCLPFFYPLHVTL